MLAPGWCHECTDGTRHSPMAGAFRPFPRASSRLGSHSRVLRRGTATREVSYRCGLRVGRYEPRMVWLMITLGSSTRAGGEFAAAMAGAASAAVSAFSTRPEAAGAAGIGRAWGA